MALASFPAATPAALASDADEAEGVRAEAFDAGADVRGAGLAGWGRAGAAPAGGARAEDAPALGAALTDADATRLPGADGKSCCAPAAGALPFVAEDDSSNRRGSLPTSLWRMSK